MKDCNSGIYKISFEGYEKVYIGSTTNLIRRWECHLWKLRRNKHQNTYLQNIFNKFGEVKAKFTVLVYAKPDKEYLLLLEQRMFDSCSFEDDLINIKRQATGGDDNPWTKDEEKFLTENYNSNRKECFIYLKDRNKTSVYGKASELGLTSRSICWSIEDDNFIRANHSSMSDRELSVVLGRTLKSVSSRKNTLGLDVKRKKSWPDEDLKFLLENHKTSLVEDLATSMNRTVYSIKNKLIRMGLNKDRLGFGIMPKRKRVTLASQE